MRLKIFIINYFFIIFNKNSADIKSADNNKLVQNE